VRDQGNLGLEIIKFQNAGISQSNKCQKGKSQKFFAQHIWIRVAAEITSDRVELPGLGKVKISLMNLKFKVVLLNLNSQRMIQLSQEDVSSLFLITSLVHNWH
jgi:hypothetical protein